MLKKGYLQYNFINEIHKAVNIYKEDELIQKTAEAIDEFLSVSGTYILYRQKETFRLYSAQAGQSSGLSLPQDSILTGSFAKRKESLHINNGLSSYRTIFDKETGNLITSADINFIHPMFHKNIYKGVILTSFKGRPKDIAPMEELLNITSSLLITSIETENSSVLNDLNYYRLYKFDRLALLGEMTASIAHELRTPMNTVILEIDEIASDSITQEEQQESIDTIKAETLRLNDFITSLLSFSRLKKRGLTKVSIQKFVEDAINRIPSKRKPKDIQLTTAFTDSPLVSTDRDRLLQVFYNILFNAFDATGEKGIISISTFIPDADNKKQVVIEIKDNGPGIPETIKNKVTQPFFTTKEEGTGLGLYISSNIMKELEGSLEIESDSSGTTISLLLNVEEG